MNNWYKKSQDITESGISVYHGSDRSDLVNLKAHFPTYEGSLGGGIYVGTNISTAEFYGRYVYELKTKFNWDQVFSITVEDNYYPIEELRSSVLMGEEVYPFCFMLNGKTYCVTSSSGGGFRQEGDLFRINMYKHLIERIENLNIDSYFKNALINFTKMREDKWGRAIDDPRDYDDVIDDYIGKLQDSGKISPNANQEEMQRFAEQMYATLAPVIQGAWEDAKESAPEEVSLDEIGELAENAGYRAVYVEGIRGRATVNEEMLVFNENDLIMVKRIQ